MEPLPNCVIAMSFTEQEAAQRWEHKVPSIDKRIEALVKLQQAGWSIALRFEPLIYSDGMQLAYGQLFQRLFDRLDASTIHSVSTGLFRMPTDYYKKIVKLYPDEALFARTTQTNDGLVSLFDNQEEEILQELEQSLFASISPQQYYRCA